MAVGVVALAAQVPGPWGAPLLVGPAAALPVILAAVALSAALLGAHRLGTRVHAVATGSTATLARSPRRKGQDR